MDIAGAEKVVYSIVRNLSKERFSFSICCLDCTGELGEHLIKEGFEVISLNRKPGVDFSLIRKLIKILKDRQIDIIHAHQYTPYFYAATAAILSARPKVIFTEHGRHQPDRIRPKRAIYNQFLNLFSDRITGVSNFSKDSLVKYEKLPARKIKVIYNGISLEEFKISLDREAKRKELGIDQDEVVMGMVGRFDPIKNQLMLLRAFSEVLKHISGTKLLLIGDGPLKEKCKKFASELGIGDRVVFLGWRRDVLELLRTLDIFVLSSLTEATSLTLLEAMAAGLPVIATDAGGNPEIIMNDRTGILISLGNYREFAKAMVSLIEDPEKRKRMGEAGIRRIKALFSIDRMLKEYEDLYLSLSNKVI
jgi:sugar transferase (PEP-CTERM/EpsH1 system associated)